MTDASNKLTLHLLEMLINTNGPLPFAHLAQTLQNKAVTDDMREVVNNSEEGLRLYICRYPSLFKVESDRVTPVIGEGTLLGNSMEPLRRSSNSPPMPLPSVSPSSASLPGVHDFTMESEAVKYFQSQLSKRDERWLPIKSISGHLSQASQRVRRAVGPQTEFLNFLRRHPHVFEVQGELVGLKDTFTTTCLLSSSTTSSLTALGSVRRRSERAPHSARLSLGSRPKSMVLDQRRADSLFGSCGSRQTTPGSPPSYGRHSAPICMTANEYKAIIFLKTCLEENDIAGLPLVTLLQKLGEARENVRNTVGWTAVELQEFLCKHNAFFDMATGDLVQAKDSRKINILISGSRPVDQGTHTLTNRRGTVFHVAKLWGIIDLGQHEHVFFDKSILRHVGDLQKYFKHGETIYFNAILAPKDSRAKWRATQVWKESDRGLVELLAGQALGSPNGPGGEDTDSGLDQELEEGLQLADDIKFLDEELEQEMAEIAALDQDGENRFYPDDLALLNTNHTFNSVRLFPANNTSSRHSTAIHEDDCPSEASSPDLSLAHSEPSTMRSIPSLAAEETAPLSASGGFARATCAPSSPQFSSPAHSTAEGEDMPDMEEQEGPRTIATQTISTGEIMATQFYHEGMSQLV